MQPNTQTATRRLVVTPRKIAIAVAAQRCGVETGLLLSLYSSPDNKWIMWDKELKKHVVFEDDIVDLKAFLDSRAPGPVKIIVNNDTEEYLSREELAERLNVPLFRIHQIHAAGKWPACKPRVRSGAKGRNPVVYPASILPQLEDLLTTPKPRLKSRPVTEEKAEKFYTLSNLERVMQIQHGRLVTLQESGFWPTTETRPHGRKTTYPESVIPLLRKALEDFKQSQKKSKVDSAEWVSLARIAGLAGMPYGTVWSRWRSGRIPNGFGPNAEGYFHRDLAKHLEPSMDPHTRALRAAAARAKTPPPKEPVKVTRISEDKVRSFSTPGTYTLDQIAGILMRHDFDEAAKFISKYKG